MATEPAVERREGALTAARIAELAESPIRGTFNVDHLKAVHAYIFQDLTHHRPGEMRGDMPGWSKFRALEGQVSVHEVHYAYDHVEQRAATILRDLGGPAAMSGLPPDAFASRMVQVYGDLDHVHPFHVMLNYKRSRNFGLYGCFRPMYAVARHRRRNCSPRGRVERFAG